MSNQYKAHERYIWTLTGVAGTNTITAAANTTFKQYFRGQIIVWEQASNNTGAATINVNGKGAVDLKKNGHSAALDADDLVAGVTYVAAHDGTNFQIVSGALTGGGGGGSVTSVDLSHALDDTVAVSGNPVTSSGTLVVTSVDPGADRIVFWDDSAGKKVYLTVGTNLAITGTTLNSTAGTGTVTSVALAATNDDTVSISGSPVTTTGTLSLNAVDAGSDKLVFWDDSAGKKVYATLGTNISITGTTINVTLDPSNQQRAFVAADGTKTFGNVTSTSLHADGYYIITMSTAMAATTSYVAHATPENDTTGTSKGFSAGTTETFSGTITPFFYVAETDEIWGVDYNTDLVHIYDVGGDASSTHDPSNGFSTSGGPTCCLAEEGDYFWISGFDTGGQIIGLDVTDKSEDFNFGSTGGLSDSVHAANANMVIWRDASAGVVKSTTYNGSGPVATLGSISRGAGIDAPGVWDEDHNCYVPHAAELLVVTAYPDGIITAKAYPSGYGVMGNVVYDVNRRCVWMSLSNDTGVTCHLYRYNVESEEFVLHYTPGKSYWGKALGYNADEDILYVAQFSESLYRYQLSTMNLIDTVSIADSVAADFDIGAGEDPWGNHPGMTFTPDGRVWVGGTGCLISLEYDGGELGITNVTHATVKHISATVAHVFLYKSISPLIRTTGAFNFTASN